MLNIKYISSGGSLNDIDKRKIYFCCDSLGFQRRYKIITEFLDSMNCVIWYRDTGTDSIDRSDFQKSDIVTPSVYFALTNLLWKDIHTVLMKNG